MTRMVWGVVAGFVAWAIAWVGIELTLSGFWPRWYGAHQHAFQEAIKHGGQFTADNAILLIHIVTATVVSVMSGFVAAMIARENKRAPLILGLVLTACGVVKMLMSWPFVPIWYHVVFTVLLLPMTIAGGKLGVAPPKKT